MFLPHLTPQSKDCKLEKWSGVVTKMRCGAFLTEREKSQVLFQTCYFVVQSKYCDYDRQLWKFVPQSVQELSWGLKLEKFNGRSSSMMDMDFGKDSTHQLALAIIWFRCHNDLFSHLTLKPLIFVRKKIWRSNHGLGSLRCVVKSITSTFSVFHRDYFLRSKIKGENNII